MTNQDNTVVRFIPEMALLLDRDNLYHLKSGDRLALGLRHDQVLSHYNPNNINYLGIATKR